ncbi:MAG TPA: sodium:calcium antiporter [Terriglobia bacterium]|nr:sodium:calcium antiporter [Terriglobia bacterium]
MKDRLWFGSAFTLCFQWIAIHLSGIHLEPHWEALSAGIGIFGAASLLSWAAELAQFDIPQSLAIAFLALVAVLPEYAVDMYFAWQAGKDPSYTPYALANMTGANRLLIGVGWAAVVFTYWLKTRRRSFALEPERRTEILYLGIATLYSFTIPWKGRLDLVDAAVFVTIFIVYMKKAAASDHVEPELEGPAQIIASWGESRRRAMTIMLFLYSGFTIFIAAEPFAESLLKTGRLWGIEEFILVQWLAPLASESPEFIVAIIFALKANPGASMGTLLSSKVNQWTLLVGMLPIAYMISAGSFEPMHMDHRQNDELLLTAAQSLLATVMLANMEFSLLEAAGLFVLFAAQLLSSDPRFHMYYSFIYIGLAAGLFLFRRSTRTSLRQLVDRKTR